MRRVLLPEKIEGIQRGTIGTAMNLKLREALPLLQMKVSFRLEEISGTDLYYNDGDSRVVKSFFKLVLPKAVVYIYEGDYWLSFGSLTDAETLALREWMSSCI